MDQRIRYRQINVDAKHSLEVGRGDLDGCHGKNNTYRGCMPSHIEQWWILEPAVAEALRSKLPELLPLLINGDWCQK
eukprot:5490104-Pleurochrysis_carterae.AAC.1